MNLRGIARGGSFDDPVRCLFSQYVGEARSLVLTATHYEPAVVQRKTPPPVSLNNTPRGGRRYCNSRTTRPGQLFILDLHFLKTFFICQRPWRVLRASHFVTDTSGDFEQPDWNCCWLIGSFEGVFLLLGEKSGRLFVNKRKRKKGMLCGGRLSNFATFEKDNEASSIVNSSFSIKFAVWTWSRESDSQHQNASSVLYFVQS